MTNSVGLRSAASVYLGAAFECCGPHSPQQLIAFRCCSFYLKGLMRCCVKVSFIIEELQKLTKMTTMPTVVQSEKKTCRYFSVISTSPIESRN